jgi:hypothetical protein
LPFTLPEEHLDDVVRRIAQARADVDRARPHNWSPDTLVA